MAALAEALNDTHRSRARAVSERTVAGMERARKAGAAIGRPRVVTDCTKVRELRAAGHSLPAIARKMSPSITTVARVCKEAA